MRRLLGFVAAAALTGGALLALSPVSAVAAPVSSCTTSSGTIVAVDFGAWGGPVVAGCDTSGPSSGWTLLTDEGFVVDPVTTQSGAVCRLGNGAFGGGTPYPTDLACRNMPPSTAYWSYWLAAPGANSWSYSDFGPTNRTPVAGGVELWIFGGSISPSCTPNAVRAGSESGCTPSSSSSSGSGSGSGGSGSGSGSGGSGSGSGSGASSSGGSGSGGSTGSGKSGSGSTSSGRVSQSTSTRSASATASSHASATTAPSSASPKSSALSASAPPSIPSGSSAPRVVQALPASKNTSTGSIVPLVVGLAIVVALGAGGGVAVWRRRRTAE